MHSMPPPQRPSEGLAGAASSTEKKSVATCVGVVGLGHMGHALASTLLACGYMVVAFDRDGQRQRALQIEGAHVAARLADLKVCDVVISSLPNDEVLETVALGANGLVKYMAAGSMHISTSTVSPHLSRRLAQAHAAQGQSFVAAAIVGNPDLARAQRIFILMAGKADATKAAHPILERLAQRVFDLGEDPGKASIMKLACNVLTAATLQSMGEVFALLRKAGLGEDTAFDVFTGTLFDGRVHKAYGGKIVEQRYSPAGMTTPLAAKDLRLALSEAERLDVPMPLAAIVHDRLVAVIAKGWAHLDWSALGALAAVDAGLPTTASVQA